MSLLKILRITALPSPFCGKNNTIFSAESCTITDFISKPRFVYSTNTVDIITTIVQEYVKNKIFSVRGNKVARKWSPFALMAVLGPRGGDLVGSRSFVLNFGRSAEPSYRNEVRNSEGSCFPALISSLFASFLPLFTVNHRRAPLVAR